MILYVVILMNSNREEFGYGPYVLDDAVTFAHDALVYDEYVVANIRKWTP